MHFVDCLIIQRYVLFLFNIKCVKYIQDCNAGIFKILRNLTQRITLPLPYFEELQEEIGRQIC